VNVEVFYELFRGLSHQGPGSEDCTLRALDAVGELAGSPRILDVGCGTGSQTLVLARRCGGNVVAVDIDPVSLDDVKRRAQSAGLGEQIETLACSMTELDFPDESFDLIWSEGAIYNMGFEKGLREWRRLLRPGCCVAVTELSWLTPDPPTVARDYWASSYPTMGSRDQNLAAVASAGYQPVECFVLPDTAWWEFYGPLEERIALLRDKYASAEDATGAMETLDAEQREIDVFRASAGSYSYVFYIARRPIDPTTER
jgi:SAM-dependent methyltransferase